MSEAKQVAERKTKAKTAKGRKNDRGPPQILGELQNNPESNPDVSADSSTSTPTLTNRPETARARKAREEAEMLVVTGKRTRKASSKVVAGLGMPDEDVSEAPKKKKKKAAQE